MLPLADARWRHTTRYPGVLRGASHSAIKKITNNPTTWAQIANRNVYERLLRDDTPLWKWKAGWSWTVAQWSFIPSHSHANTLHTGWPPKKQNSRFVLGLCSDQQLFFFTLLDRASFPHYNNTKIIKFGWELFILWVISYGLSFSGFAINLSLIVPRNSGNWANPENDSP